MSTNNQGLSVALPLMADPTFGLYDLNTTFEDLAKQNFKMLLLTNPGERIMRPRFGVGLRRYLFQPNTEITYDAIVARIGSQVEEYLPYIGVDSIDFDPPQVGADFDPSSISMTIFFTILPLQIATFLQIS